MSADPCWRSDKIISFCFINLPGRTDWATIFKESWDCLTQDRVFTATQTPQNAKQRYCLHLNSAIKHGHEQCHHVTCSIAHGNTDLLLFTLYFHQGKYKQNCTCTAISLFLPHISLSIHFIFVASQCKLMSLWQRSLKKKKNLCTLSDKNTHPESNGALNSDSHCIGNTEGAFSLGIESAS